MGSSLFLGGVRFLALVRTESGTWFKKKAIFPKCHNKRRKRRRRKEEEREGKKRGRRGEEKGVEGVERESAEGGRHLGSIEPG